MKYLTKDEMTPEWNHFKKEVEAYILSKDIKYHYLEVRVPDYFLSSMLNGVVREGDNIILYEIPAPISPTKIAGCEVYFTKTNENKLALYDYIESKSVIEKNLENRFS